MCEEKCEILLYIIKSIYGILHSLYSGFLSSFLPKTMHKKEYLLKIDVAPKTQKNKQTKNTILRGGHRRPPLRSHICATPPKEKCLLDQVPRRTPIIMLLQKRERLNQATYI